ncbi:MAG TPA: MFS transporter, partial [Actinomycetota bacterium]|nr:MFS transporter [Actinomycetota bacterium]
MSSRAAQPTTLARVREIFAQPGFGRFFSTRITSQVGDGIFQLATADLLLFDNPGANPALTLAILSAVTLVPFSIVAPFVGVFIDRWDRRTILQVVPLVRAVLAATIALGVGGETHGPLFYLLVLLVLSANRFFLATMSAVLPQFVPEDDLLVANSVSSTGGSVSNVIGLGIGSALAAVVGGTATAGFAAIAFLGGALLARGLHVQRGLPKNVKPLREDVRDVVIEMVDGVRRLRESAKATFALSAVSVNQFLIGAMTGVVASYFIKNLDLGVGAITGLLGVIAFGIGIGVATVPAIARIIGRERMIPLSFAVAAVTLFIVGITLSRVIVIASAWLVGLAYAIIKIPVDTIVQEEMPDSYRGRAFAAYDMLFNVARVSGTIVAAILVGIETAPAVSVVLLGAAYAGASLFSLHRTRRFAVTPMPQEPGPPAAEEPIVAPEPQPEPILEPEPRPVVAAAAETHP